jgi:beta-glucosidase
MMDYDIQHARTYLYLKQKPLYAFGYGLSYTSFAYSNLAVSSDSLKGDGELSMKVDLKNTGSRSGDEIVQLYVSHIGSKVARPIAELKGFERVGIGAGETKTVTLPLKASDLAYWDDTTKRWTVEADKIELRIGSSSDDIKLRKTVSIAP